MKYKVLKTYTPDDQGADRSRYTAEFESDSMDIFELAYLACLACFCSSNKADIFCVREGQRILLSLPLLTYIRQILEQSNAAEQLEDQDVSRFEFILFGNSGEWCLEVEAVE